MTVKPRKPILALGGPYVRLCNYKREIVGNLNSMKRCYICLNSKGSDGKSVNIWCWGMLLCRECYREYTLSKPMFELEIKFEGLPFSLAAISALRIMPTILPAVYFVDNDGHRIKNATTEIYFKPAIDNVLRIYTALDFQTNFLVFKRYQQEEEKDRLESSRLEANRRIVRQWIVAAAEQMWEGIDPWPAPTMCGDTGEFLGWHQRAWMPTKASFKAFRDRFAPTRMLKHFLFPDYALCDTPSQLPYNAATGWMQDPTMSLKKRDDFDERVTVAWICDNALKMLILLTDCHHPEYHRKGRGGYVSNWLEAAKTWHLARLEIELEYGATVRVDYTPNGLAGLRRCWRIHKLRVKLGMQLESSDGMDPLPQRSVRGIEVSSEAYEEFSRLDRLATDAEQKRAEGIKHFNKIIRHACVACPATSYLIYPMGFEGMLEHLRMGHTELYFESDDFHALG